MLAAIICFSTSIFAQATVHPKVTLKSLTPQFTSEKRGDELYLNITEFTKAGETRHYRIPHAPLFWSSRHLDKVQNVALWDKALENDAAAEVVFEVVEHDVPPWNIDDLIAIIRLKIHNNNGKLEYKWSVFNQELPEHAQPGPDNTFTFDVKDRHGHYNLVLSLD